MFACAVYLALLPVVLGDKVFLGGGPRFLSAVLPVVQEFGLEYVGEVHLRNEVIESIGVGENDDVVLAFDLPAFEMMGKGCDMGVGCVAPRLAEEFLHVKLLLVGNDTPCLELFEHCCNGLILVLYIVSR